MFVISMKTTLTTIFIFCRGHPKVCRVSHPTPSVIVPFCSRRSDYRWSALCDCVCVCVCVCACVCVCVCVVCVCVREREREREKERVCLSIRYSIYIHPLSIFVCTTERSFFYFCFFSITVSEIQERICAYCVQPALHPVIVEIQ